MKVLKAIGMTTVFLAGAFAGGFAVLYTTILLGSLLLAQAQSQSKYDVGNGGILYFFLGAVLALIAAPFAGALAVIGVEHMTKLWSKPRAR